MFFLKFFTFSDVPVVEKLGSEEKETTTGKACLTVAVRPTVPNVTAGEAEESVANGDGLSSEAVTKEDSVSTVSAVKENGDSAETGVAANKTAADDESAVAATNAAASSSEVAVEEPADVVVTAENGVNKSEANGDATGYLLLLIGN